MRWRRTASGRRQVWPRYSLRAEHQASGSLLPNSRVLLHQPLISGVMTGPATDLEIEAREMLRIRERLYEILAQHTGQPVEKIEKDCDRNLWLAAQEAIKLRPCRQDSAKGAGAGKTRRTERRLISNWPIVSLKMQNVKVKRVKLRQSGLCRDGCFILLLYVKWCGGQLCEQCPLSCLTVIVRGDRPMAAAVHRRMIGRCGRAIRSCCSKRPSLKRRHAN